MSDSEFTVTTHSRRIIRRWTWITLGGIAGALLAAIFAQTRPPVYEASAVLAVNLDYPRLVPLDLIVEDRLLNRVARVLTSDQTLDLVAAQLTGVFGESRAWSTRDELRRHLRLDTKLADWNLIGISEDPVEAAVLANTWAEVSLAVLDAAYDHAWAALALQEAPLVISCSELATGAPVSFFWECLTVGTRQSAEETEALRAELRLSRGVTPGLTYEAAEAAIVPGEPVVWSRGPLILSGMLLGLILGTVLAASMRPRGRTPPAGG